MPQLWLWSPQTLEDKSLGHCHGFFCFPSFFPFSLFCFPSLFLLIVALLKGDCNLLVTKYHLKKEILKKSKIYSFSINSTCINIYCKIVSNRRTITQFLLKVLAQFFFFKFKKYFSTLIDYINQLHIKTIFQYNAIFRSILNCNF